LSTWKTDLKRNASAAPLMLDSLLHSPFLGGGV
jgi:hypothetical protein